MARTSRALRARTTTRIADRSADVGAERGAGRTRTGRPARQETTALRDRLRYRFDNSVSRGTPALVAWLCVVTLVLIVVFALLTTLLGLREGPDQGFWKELFYSMNHALDAGFIGGGTGSWQFLLLMLVLTLAGLFIVSALIGVISAGIDDKLAQLRRGRSIVLEADHTVVLGWSDSIFTIISELSIANESRSDPVVVVMAPRDKVEMEDEIAAKVPDLRGTRVVCRSGSPMDVDDLRLTRHTAARSVVVLAPASDDPDSEVIKCLLALTHALPVGDDAEVVGPRIVAEIRNPSNLEAARLVGTARTVLIDIRDTVAKLLVQTSRQSGAAAVYVELLDYDGDEIYFLPGHALAGATYAEAQLAFESASVIGLVDGGVPLLNPSPDTVVGDRTLVVVAADDDGLATQQSPGTLPDLDALGTATELPPEPTQAVLIGWNERAPTVLAELDKYAAPGSSLTVLTTYGDPQVPELDRLAVTVTRAPTTDRAVLERHVTAELDQVIVLCYSEHLGQQAADARTLVTLLHVRDILGRLDVATPVVSEMLDDRNRVLAEVADVDDVVVSGEIVSLLVTQLSEDQRLEAVFGQLLGDQGSEVYLRPAELYVRLGQVSYATVVAGASRRGETAIGFKSGPEVRVNPPKSAVLDVGAGDRVVVLADS